MGNIYDETGTSSMKLFGRRVIYADANYVDRTNIIEVLNEASYKHEINRSEIEYLYQYYKGNQPALYREKEIRPEICNHIVENRANEIVSFKVGYLFGEPVQYVSRGDDETVSDQISKLNDYMLAEDKASKDKSLAEWSHICGTSYRMVCTDESAGVDPDEAPFEIYTLDPRNTFVVYSNSLGNKPILAVNYVTRNDRRVLYSCYTEDRMYVVENGVVTKEELNPLGVIPIIEYPANDARLGAFEIVLPLLDAINNVDSNRMDGVEQFVQALMLFHNVNLTDDDIAKIPELGGLRFTDIDGTMKGEVSYITAELNQSQTQTLDDHFYDTILTICGMPNRNGGSSTSDTGSAVIMRDGWSAAEARAKDSELMFKQSEKHFLKAVLKICRELSDLDLKLSNLEVRFTRRNYENISEKSSVLIGMLGNEKIHPLLAFTHCGMFSDPNIAYQMSMEYYEDNKAENTASLEAIAGIAQEEDTEDDELQDSGQTAEADN